MTTQLLTRRHYTPPKGQVFARLAENTDDLALAFLRAHEFCGSSRRTLALMLAAQMAGPVLWILPAWQRNQLNPQGIAQFLDPSRLILITPTRGEDLLWSMEEALRSGAAPLVIADCETPPALTPVRRLHLAAQGGAEFSAHKPLGLLLTPGDGGAAGVESRWHMAPNHRAGRSEWRLQRRRARMAPPATWAVGWQAHAKGVEATGMAVLVPAG